MSFFTDFFSFKKKEPEFPLLKDFSAITTDIHSHFIPGIDDGATSIEDSMLLLRSMYELGFRKFITTPHIMSDAYNNTPEIILKGLEEIRKAIALENLPITISAAAEYYVDAAFVNKFQNEKLLTITGNTVLVEISYMNLPDRLTEIFFQMRLAGYTILLAHPERYPFWYHDFNEYRDLKNQGVQFQINLNSLSGYYGIPAKKLVERMIEENMVDYVGSDMHGVRHLPALKDALKSRYLAMLVNHGVKNQQL